MSSTFRDMHAERDYLRQIVFPALEEKLRERCIRLEPVDLRWGVETVSVDDQEAKELLVLKVCLAEIERSHPYLIGLLGDRYGWIPPEERIRAAAGEAGFPGEVAGKSVTALEIEFGVLSKRPQMARSFFYLRDPLPYDAMTTDVAVMYNDGAQALAELKRELTTRYPDRVRRYRAAWDPAGQRVTGLEEFGRLVLEDLSKALEAETVAPARTWQEREHWILGEFIDRASQDFEGRDALLDQLVRFAQGDETGDDLSARCVVGEPGSGKSALFAALARRLGKKTLVLSHAAGVSPDSVSVDRLLRRWILELATFLGIEDPAPRVEAIEGLVEQLRSLLTQASLRKPVVCLIDALNQFERTTMGVHLTWLPRPWPDEARLIATTVDGPEARALLERGAALLELPRLAGTESEQIITAMSRRHRKRLHPDITRALLTRTRPGGSPAAGSPLWLTLALDHLFLLDADDFERAERSYSGSSEERLHAMLLDTIQRLPADIEGLYDYLLKRNERIHGSSRARAFASFLAISRNGLRESDLEKLLPGETGEPWDGLHAAALRRGFRAHLVQRGALSQWDLTHAQMRHAVLLRYFQNPDEKRRYHARIADYLEHLPPDDGLRRTEIMVHYIGANDPDRAARYFGGELTEPEARGATEALIRHMGETENGLAWVLALPPLPQPDDPMAVRLCRRFRESLAPAARNVIDLDAMGGVLQASHSRLAAICEQSREDFAARFELALTLHALGHSLASAGDIGTALERYRAARQILDDLSGDGSATRRLDVSTIAYERARVAASQAGALLATGMAREALEPARLAQAMAEQLARSDADSFERERDLSISHSGLGDVLRALGDMAGALAEYAESEKRLERLRDRPEHRREVLTHLTIVQNKIAVAWAQAGQPDRAIEVHRKVLEERKAIARAAPDDREAQVSLGIAWNQLGADLVMMGDGGGGLRAHEAALAIRKEMVALDQGNGDWQQLLAASLRNIADARVMLGQVASALSADLEAIAIRRNLAGRYPGNAAYQQSLASTWFHVAGVYVMMGMVRESIEALCDAGELQDRLVRGDPDNAMLRQELEQTRQVLQMMLPGVGPALGPELSHRALGLLNS